MMPRASYRDSHRRVGPRRGLPREELKAPLDRRNRKCNRVLLATRCNPLRPNWHQDANPAVRSNLARLEAPCAVVIRRPLRGRATSSKSGAPRADLRGKLTLVSSGYCTAIFALYIQSHRFLSNMDTVSIHGNGTRPYVSPESHAKLSQHSPADEQDWSGEGSSGDEAIQASGGTKRKRPLSVSCEICKQRKVSSNAYVSRLLWFASACRCRRRVTRELATQRDPRDPAYRFHPQSTCRSKMKQLFELASASDMC